MKIPDCPTGRWGKTCSNDCMCKNNATCDPLTGICSCQRGWSGEDCSEPCPDDTYGLKCSEKCRCAPGSICDHISGECRCPPGRTGPL